MLFISPAITANLKTFCFGISACCSADYRATRCRPPLQGSPQRPRARHAGNRTLRDTRTPAAPETPLCWSKALAGPAPAAPGTLLCPARCRNAATLGLLAACAARDGDGTPCAVPPAANVLRGAALGAPRGQAPGTAALRAHPAPTEPRAEAPEQLLSQPRRLDPSLGRINAWQEKVLRALMGS